MHLVAVLVKLGIGVALVFGFGKIMSDTYEGRAVSSRGGVEGMGGGFRFPLNTLGQTEHQNSSHKDPL